MLPQKHPGTFPLLLLIILFIGNTHSAFTHSSFSSTNTNQGAISHYSFSFLTSLSHSNPDLVITFPIEYSISDFVGQLECYQLTDGLPDQYHELECWV